MSLSSVAISSRVYQIERDTTESVKLKTNTNILSITICISVQSSPYIYI